MPAYSSWLACLISHPAGHTLLLSLPVIIVMKFSCLLSRLILETSWLMFSAAPSIYWKTSVSSAAKKPLIPNIRFIFWLTSNIESNESTLSILQTYNKPIRLLFWLSYTVFIIPWNAMSRKNELLSMTINIIRSRLASSFNISKALNLTTASDFDLLIRVLSIKSPLSYFLLPPPTELISSNCSGFKEDISHIIVGFQPYPMLNFILIVLSLGLLYFAGSTTSAFRFVNRCCTNFKFAKNSGVIWARVNVVGMMDRPTMTF